MRRIIGFILLAVIAVGVGLSLTRIPFGTPKTSVGDYYIRE